MIQQIINRETLVYFLKLIFYDFLVNLLTILAVELDLKYLMKS